MKKYNPILLTPDSAEGQDPLDTNVSDIDTSFPRVAAGLYDLRIGDIVKEPTKNGDGERLTIPLVLTEDTTATDGKTRLNKGSFSLKHYIGLTPREASEENGKKKQAYTNVDIAKGIAAISKAAGLTCTAREVINNPAMLTGKVVRTKVKIQKETDEFPESNKIAEFVVIQ